MSGSAHYSATRAAGFPQVWLWLAPALFVLVVLYLLPLLQILWISVVEPGPGIGNYVKLIETPGIRRVFATTFRVAAITTLISVTLGYVVAYAMIGRSGWALKRIVIGVMIPFWISVLVRAFAWVALLRTTGVVNTVLLALHIIAEPLDLLYTEAGVVVGMVHCLTPVAALTLYGQMTGIDRRVMTAARGLGAGPFYAFRRVFLPQSLPGIAASVILVFIAALGYYIIPALLGGGKTLMLAEYTSLLITETVNWGLGTAMASSLVAVTFLLVLLLSRVARLDRAFGGR